LSLLLRTPVAKNQASSLGMMVSYAVMSILQVRIKGKGKGRELELAIAPLT